MKLLWHRHNWSRPSLLALRGFSLNPLSEVNWSCRCFPHLQLLKLKAAEVGKRVIQVIVEDNVSPLPTDTTKMKGELNYEKRGESSFRSYWKSLELICTVSTHWTTECSMFRKDGCQLCQSSTLLEKCVCPKEVGIFNLTKGKHKWVWIKLRLKCSVQSVQSFSHVLLSATPWTAAHQASLSITNSQSLLKFMSIVSVMPSSHLILWCPLLVLPSIFPSIRSFPMSWFFTSGGQSIRVSASASVLPMNIQDWFPLGLTGWISL